MPPGEPVVQQPKPDTPLLEKSSGSNDSCCPVDTKCEAGLCCVIWMLGCGLGLWGANEGVAYCCGHHIIPWWAAMSSGGCLGCVEQSRSCFRLWSPACCHVENAVAPADDNAEPNCVETQIK